MEEKRKFTRIQALKEVRYKHKESKDLMATVPVRDLSLIGISIYAQRKFDRGEKLELDITFPGESLPTRVSGEVRWQLTDEDNNFITGVRFFGVDDDAQKRLTNFIDKHISSNVEHRTAVRCKLEVEVQYALLESPGKTYTAKAVDISKGGMRIRVKERIEKGQYLKLNLRLPSYTDIMQIEGKIVWLRPGDSVYKQEAGIIFSQISDLDKKLILRFVERQCEKELKRSN
ncbi:MAG: PilZ domain-containing protein [Candidatus Omnitrophica bacterium]|nr:PilZ domain-containing protein [Candidatus Omnitrophota bacterium]